MVVSVRAGGARWGGLTTTLIGRAAAALSAARHPLDALQARLDLVQQAYINQFNVLGATLSQLQATSRISRSSGPRPAKLEGRHRSAAVSRALACMRFLLCQGPHDSHGGVPAVRRTGVEFPGNPRDRAPTNAAILRSARFSPAGSRAFMPMA
jgi:hypothetical protein